MLKVAHPIFHIAARVLSLFHKDQVEFFNELRIGEMMKSKILLLCALFSLSALADSLQKVTIDSLDEGNNLEVYGDKYNARDSSKLKQKKSHILSVAQINSLLAEAQLSTDLAHMDQLDRDILIYDAKKLALAELTAKYSTLEKKKLQTLKEKIPHE